MATLIEWYKTTLDFLKGNKVLLLIVTALLGGNIYQAAIPTKVIQETKVTNPCICNLKGHVKEHH